MKRNVSPALPKKDAFIPDYTLYKKSMKSTDLDGFAFFYIFFCFTINLFV